MLRHVVYASLLHFGVETAQIYIPADRGVARDVLMRAKAAGYRAVVVTIDAFVPSNRETDLRNHFRSPLPNANFPGQVSGYGQSPVKTDLGWDDIAYGQEIETAGKTGSYPILA